MYCKLFCGVRPIPVLVLFSAAVFGGCGLLIDYPGDNAPLTKEVEYRVVATDASAPAKAYAIFYVDEHGDEVTLNSVDLPWSYGGTYASDGRIAASISQQTGREIELQFFINGEMSHTVRVSGSGTGVSTRGYDSDPSAAPGANTTAAVPE